LDCDIILNMKRTLVLETEKLVNKRVTLFGWVNSIRKHGKIVFVDLRDRSGIVQLVGGKELKKLGREDVIKVTGAVKKRDEKAVNPKLATGKIEITVEETEVLAQAKPLPIDIYGSGLEIDERVRLKYRYLDLRRPRLQKNLRLRSRLANLFRQALLARDFVEVETPLLTKSTPEGARDFLVPSRLQPGEFYALPQSPQQYKQLLMVAGLEKYFQLARCLRDEDLRADRQFEFTQVDVEMSFAIRDEVISQMEEVIIEVIEKAGGKIFRKPFPRLTYQEAMEKYGADKFDLRKNKKSDELAFAWVIDFPLFEQTETKAINPMHHPFTSPNPEDISLLDKNPLKVRSWQYDLVCNGYEVGGGSIRITDPELQARIFSILGHTQKEIRQKFGHLLEAFKYGVPPHGGIALGFGRILMLLAGEESLREVIPFPVNSSGQTAVMGAPSTVNENQLKELGLSVVKK